MSSKIFIFLLISNFKKNKFKIHMYIFFKENYDFKFDFSFSHMSFCYISNVVLFFMWIFKTNKWKHKSCNLLQFVLVTQSIYILPQNQK